VLAGVIVTRASPDVGNSAFRLAAADQIAENAKLWADADFVIHAFTPRTVGELIIGGSSYPFIGIECGDSWPGGYTIAQTPIMEPPSAVVACPPVNLADDGLWIDDLRPERVLKRVYGL
jgi:hypothetical protein